MFQTSQPVVSVQFPETEDKSKIKYSLKDRDTAIDLASETTLSQVGVIDHADILVPEPDLPVTVTVSLVGLDSLAVTVPVK